MIHRVDTLKFDFGKGGSPSVLLIPRNESPFFFLLSSNGRVIIGVDVETEYRIIVGGIEVCLV